MQHDPIILGVANAESQQGKSHITLLLANALTLAGHRVVVLDCDEINPQENSPTVSSYLNPSITYPFRVYTRDTWEDQYLAQTDYLIYDGSRQPPQWVVQLMQQSADGVIIPIHNGRGFAKGIEAARSMFRHDTPIAFIANDLHGDPARKLPAIAEGFNAPVFGLPNLPELNDMTSAGLLPQMTPHQHITLAADQLCNAVCAWINNIRQEQTHNEKHLHAVAG